MKFNSRMSVPTAIARRKYTVKKEIKNSIFVKFEQY